MQVHYKSWMNICMNEFHKVDIRDKIIIKHYEPYALNDEFQHFILRFYLFISKLWIPLKEIFGGEKRPNDMVILQKNKYILLHLYALKTFTHVHVIVFDKYLHWPPVIVEKYIYIATL